MVDIPEDVAHWMGNYLASSASNHHLTYVVVSPRQMMQDIKAGDLCANISKLKEKHPMDTKYVDKCLYGIPKKDLQISPTHCVGCDSQEIDSSFEELDAFSFGEVESVARIEFECASCGLKWGALSLV